MKKYTAKLAVFVVFHSVWKGAQWVIIGWPVSQTRNLNNVYRFGVVPPFLLVDGWLGIVGGPRCGRVVSMFREIF